MSTLTSVADRIVEEYSAIEPVRAARSMGVGMDGTTLTDFSPEGFDAIHEFMRRTRRDVDAAEVTSEAERLGRLYLLGWLDGELAMLDTGERQRLVSVLIGPQSMVRMTFDLMSRSNDDEWERVAARLEAVPGAMAGYRATLARATPLSRRSVVAVADQCRTWAGTGGGWFAELVAPYGDGRLRRRLDAAARRAAEAYGDLGRWLSEELARRAEPVDGVGDDRYATWSRWMLGTELDLDDTYEWGWEELARLEHEKRGECDRIVAGASFAEVRRLLETDRSRAVHGVDAYRAWLQEITDDAIERLDGSHFDIPEPLRRCEIGIPPEGSAAAPYYTPPSEDLSHPGRTWFPTLGAEMFPTWDQVTVAYHEAVPGHHLQLGTTRIVPLVRAHRVGFNSAHGEGWALYAERLMDELGFFDDPATRLGFLASQAFRAVRVVIDIGLHTGRTIPDGWHGAGQPWDPSLAADHLERAGGVTKAFADSEVVRYISMPSQAISYKVGERVWLAGREDAAAANAGSSFDLKAWHARALALGALGLDDLAGELARC